MLQGFSTISSLFLECSFPGHMQGMLLYSLFLFMSHLINTFLGILSKIAMLSSTFVSFRCFFYITFVSFKCSFYITQLFKKIQRIVDLQYSVSISCPTQQTSYTCAYTCSLCRFLSHLGHFRVLSRIPCAIQQAHFSYLFYIQQYGYISPNLPVYPSPHLPPSNSKFHFLPLHVQTLFHSLLYFFFYLQLKCKF